MNREPSDEALIEAYTIAGSVRKAGHMMGVSKDRVWRALRKAGVDTIEPQGATGKPRITDEMKGSERVVTGANVMSLDELLLSADIDPSEWIVTRQRRNSWQALGKDSEVIQLHQITAHLERVPDFFVEPVEPIGPIPRTPSNNDTKLRCALIVPDIQAGFRRVENNSSPGGYDWIPLHDRKAMSCVLQIAELMKEDITDVVYLGDNLDLAPWSTRWTSGPELKYTTNAALRELYAGFMVPMREILPSSRQVLMQGNHEQRIDDCLQAKLGEASNLRSADTLDGDPLLSIESLLALDSIDVEYFKPYGAIYWLFDKIRVQHGSIARRHAGATAAEYLKTATSSIIWGHTHRLEMGQKRLQTPHGVETITAASPGCLCRSDMGVVPAVKGNPLDWQQGVGIVYEHDGRHSIQLIPIVDGVAMFEGELIVGRDIPEEWASKTGLPF